jgi:hypothetical protein
MKSIGRLIVLLMIFYAQSAIAQKAGITVLLLSAHSGKPLKHRDVQIFGTNSRHGLLGENTVFHVQAQTGANGAAHFQLDTPLPARFVFYSAQADMCMPSSSLYSHGVEQTGL